MAKVGTTCEKLKRILEKQGVKCVPFYGERTEMMTDWLVEYDEGNRGDGGVCVSLWQKGDDVFMLVRTLRGGRWYLFSLSPGEWVRRARSHMTPEEVEEALR